MASNLLPESRRIGMQTLTLLLLVLVSHCLGLVASAADTPIASFEIRPSLTNGVAGSVPAVVTFDATKSISRTWSTQDWYGIQHFRWSFGDGAAINTRQPSITHTFLWPGDFHVVLTVWNNKGLTNSTSATCRVVGQDGFPHRIFHVKTNGSDLTGNGSFGAPWNTIAKAVGSVGAGDYVAVHQGRYSEYVDVNRNVATETDRISVIGYGAMCGGVKIRHPNWTWDGFDMNYSPGDAADAVVYVMRDADNTWILNNYIHDTPLSIYGVEALSPGVTGPLDGALNGKVVNNIFSNVGHIVVQLFNGSNWLIHANQAYDTWGEGDFVRPMGVNHIVSDNYCSNLNNRATGGHADFFQIPEPGAVYVRDIIIENNLVVGLTNLTVRSGAITCLKAAGANPVIASAPIFNDTHNHMTLWLSESKTFWRITNVISSTMVEVHSSNAISSAETFYLEPDDAAVAQMASAHFGHLNYTNIVFRNNVFWRVRGTCSDSIDGLKFYNNLFYDTPRAGGNVTAGGGVNGSSYGTEFFNNIFYNVSSVVASSGWYYNATDSGNPGSNTTVYADYNAVYPSKQAGPPNDIFHWAAINSSGPLELNGFNGVNPRFVDPANGGFRLSADSPLLNAGRDLSSSFRKDILGRTRTGWSIGPFETGSSSGVLSSPTNLRVVE